MSLTLDMCTPGTTETYGMLLSPRDQSAQEYLENASNPLTPAQLHIRALDDAVLQAEFYVRLIKKYIYAHLQTQLTFVHSEIQK